MVSCPNVTASLNKTHAWHFPLSVLLKESRTACLCLSYSHLPNILFGFYILSISHRCQLSPPSRIPQAFPPQDNVFPIRIPQDPWGMVEINSSISSSHMRRSFQNSTKCLDFIRSRMEKREQCQDCQFAIFLV